ncbi:MAG TPA: hypothetical protein VKV28_16335 [Candidatus Binataceae bacterium]|nr:hypothetical protein [Candidatus Binataceae bacterium]
MKVLLAIILIGAAAGCYYAYRSYRAQQNQLILQAVQIHDLQQQLAKLQNDDQVSHQALAQVQKENNRLAAVNDSLAKALAQAKVTGKVPNILPAPYPPK